MKQKLICATTLCLFCLILINTFASALERSLERNLKYYPAAAACLSSLNLPGVAGAGLVDMGSMFMEYKEDEDSDDAETVNSSQSATNANNYLDATEKDFDTLESMLTEFKNPIYDLVSNDLTVDERMYNFLGRANSIYSYYFSKEAEDITAKEAADLGILIPTDTLRADDIYAYLAYPADEIDWIMENIFNYTPNQNFYDGNDVWAYSARIGDVYYENRSISTGSIVNFDLMKKPLKTEAGTYSVRVIYVAKFTEVSKVFYFYDYTCALTEIDGVRRWVFLDAAEANSESPIITVED